MDPRKNATLKTYDEVANLYANDFSRDFTHFDFIDDLLKLLSERNLTDKGIIDLGSGHGTVVEYILEKKPINITAVDITPDFCLMLENKFGSLPVKIVQGDMTEYLKTLPDGSIGAITANYGIIHIPDEEIETLLKLIYDKLTPGGLFFSSNHEGTFKGLMTDPYQTQKDKRLYTKEKLEVYMNFFTTEELKHQLLKAGFCIIRMESFKPETTEGTHDVPRIFVLAERK
jgi:ubiquinone/menaquinone biosynthesis C-methylase UbiE